MHLHSPRAASNSYPPASFLLTTAMPSDVGGVVTSEEAVSHSNFASDRSASPNFSAKVAPMQSMPQADGKHSYHYSNGSNEEFVTPRSFASVDLMQQPLRRDGKAFPQHVKHASDEVRSNAVLAQGHSGNHQRTGSYAGSYREFIANGSHSTATTAVSSQVTSAATSAAQSRNASRPSSGYSSYAVSGQTSRTGSPVSKKADADDVSALVDDSLVRGEPSQSQLQYVEAVRFSSAGNVVPPAKEEAGLLSFNTFRPSADALESPPRRHSRPAPRPNHFTFSQEDILRSFAKAAERERQRQEREAEKARERAALEAAEYQRKAREQAAKDQAAREAALQKQLQRQQQYQRGTVGADWSSDEDDVMMPSGRRPRPQPHHFRFSTNDLNKSASKPSQRQSIGHWTTFPRSSTIMLPADQLRAEIMARIAEQQEADRIVRRQAQLLLEQQQLLAATEQQSSVSNSPVSRHRATTLMDSNGSQRDRPPVSARRASVSGPSVPSPAVHGKQASGVSHTPSQRPAHSRSNSMALADRHNAALVADWDASTKLARMDLNGFESQDARSIRRSGSAGAARASPVQTVQRAASGDSLPSSRRATAPQGVFQTGAPPAHRSQSLQSLNMQSVGAVQASALDLSARRRQALRAGGGSASVESTGAGQSVGPNLQRAGSAGGGSAASFQRLPSRAQAHTPQPQLHARRAPSANGHPHGSPLPINQAPVWLAGAVPASGYGQRAIVSQRLF